jgi:hypothetical protein
VHDAPAAGTEEWRSLDIRVGCGSGATRMIPIDPFTITDERLPLLRGVMEVPQDQGVALDVTTAESRPRPFEINSAWPYWLVRTTPTPKTVTVTNTSWRSAQVHLQTDWTSARLKMVTWQGANELGDGHVEIEAHDEQSRTSSADRAGRELPIRPQAPASARERKLTPGHDELTEQHDGDQRWQRT